MESIILLVTGRKMERSKIKEALLKAYEAGWRGSLELKEEYAEKTLDDICGTELQAKDFYQQATFSFDGSNSYQPITIQDGAAAPQHEWVIQENTIQVTPTDGVEITSEWVANRANWNNVV
jgi:hypothetical protein